MCVSIRRPGSTLLELQGAGHFSFLDYQTSLQQAVCSTGPSDPAAVRQLAQQAVLSLAQSTPRAVLAQQAVLSLAQGTTQQRVTSSDTAVTDSTAHSLQVVSEALGLSVTVMTKV